jgi:hypothetical protein
LTDGAAEERNELNRFRFGEGRRIDPGTEEIVMVRREVLWTRIVLRATVFTALVVLTGLWQQFYGTSAKPTVPKAAGLDAGSGATKSAVELPRVYLDTTYVAPKGNKTTVSA